MKVRLAFTIGFSIIWANNGEQWRTTAFKTRNCFRKPGNLQFSRMFVVHPEVWSHQGLEIRGENSDDSYTQPARGTPLPQ